MAAGRRVADGPSIRLSAARRLGHRAAFATGADRALAWVARRPGVEALAVLPEGTKRRTPGLPEHLPASGPADWRATVG
ncbi:hypothetical protein [Kitasatospora sp. NPDC018619]|uniref:hypothetical protein n=1 Tax=unclassified Kitasatospora TaxID=2633591 RepID=UPI003795ADD5